MDALYDLSAEIRCTNLYQYANIYLAYEIKGPADYQFGELQEAILFDTKTGEPNGTGLGDVFDNKVMLSVGHKFNLVGSYSIRITQFMRTEQLSEVERIGFRVAYQTKE